MAENYPQPPIKINVKGDDNIVVVGKDNIVTKIVNIFEGDTKQQRTWRNRQAMLNLVYNTWVEGVLKKSLYNEVRLELGLETQPDAVGHPWDAIVQMPDKDPRLIPSGKTMLVVFQEANNSLLILGKPGAGKTTMLLELTMQLIDCAKEDLTNPIPVVFNLSSWTSKQTIAEWLVNELKDKYYVSKKLGRRWVEQDELLLLLDGLDEVKAENREGCVEAINNFLEEHTVQVAVCCRNQEYEALAARQKLQKLRSAILIQPLSIHQIDEYLAQAGQGLLKVQQMLRKDGELVGFFQTPLALSILILTYENALEEDLESLLSATDRRKQLFDVYVKQMLSRRRQGHRYNTNQIKGWLAYLASQLKRGGQSVFYIENMDTKWIPSAVQANQVWTLIYLLLGLIVWLIVGLVVGMLFGLVVGLVVWLIFGLSFGLLLRLSSALFDKNISSFEPTDRLNWSWIEAKKWLIIVLIGGLIFGLPFGLIGGLTYGLSLGLLGGLGVGIGLQFQGLRSIRIADRGKPEQGVQDSLKNAVSIGLIYGLSFGLSSGLIFGLIFEPSVGLSVGLISGLMIGLMIGMIYGGGFVIDHFALRLTLYRANLLPWNLVAFLDYCTDRIFLRKVGGGYIFIHRMLMEHFAEMEIAPQDGK